MCEFTSPYENTRNISTEIIIQILMLSGILISELLVAR